MYKDEASSRYYDGTAIHWYESTYDYFPEELQYAHKRPQKISHSNRSLCRLRSACLERRQMVLEKEATDWGYDWRGREKYLHPKYAPVNRYARDIIGCLNNWVDGWVDWNMVLDTKGGPNWANNWCIAL
ncbi:MAG: hypothetical protein CM15mP83_2700 [Flavobacteriaceae bacterium]|nr:MAG: hypothetical protein CM15mP83_2700 [Flavobacteriaceae bacterium]